MKIYSYSAKIINAYTLIFSMLITSCSAIENHPDAIAPPTNDNLSLGASKDENERMNIKKISALNAKAKIIHEIIREHNKKQKNSLRITTGTAAIAGGIIGGLLDRNKKRGIAIGAVAGGLTGFLVADNINKSKKQAIYESIQNIKVASKEIEDIASNIKRLKAIRTEQVEFIINRIENNKIKEEQAKSLTKIMKKELQIDRGVIRKTTGKALSYTELLEQKINAHSSLLSSNLYGLKKTRETLKTTQSEYNEFIEHAIQKIHRCADRAWGPPFAPDIQEPNEKKKETKPVTQKNTPRLAGTIHQYQ